VLGLCCAHSRSPSPCRGERSTDPRADCQVPFRPKALNRPPSLSTDGSVPDGILGRADMDLVSCGHLGTGAKNASLPLSAPIVGVPHVMRNRVSWTRLAGVCLLPVCGCMIDPVFPLDRKMALKVRVVDDLGRPVDAAEVWVDDGRSVSVDRFRGNKYAFRTSDGKWHEYDYVPGAGPGPGEISWTETYPSVQDLPSELRILVIREGVPVALVRRPLTSADTVEKAGYKQVEVITLRGPASRESK
jgi:hypothetical protein